MKTLILFAVFLTSNLLVSSVKAQDPLIEAGLVGIGSGENLNSRLSECGENLVYRILSDSRLPRLNNLNRIAVRQYSPGHFSITAFDRNGLKYSGHLTTIFQSWLDSKIVCAVAQDTISGAGMRIQE